MVDMITQVKQQLLVVYQAVWKFPYPQFIVFHQGIDYILAMCNVHFYSLIMKYELSFVGKNTKENSFFWKKIAEHQNNFKRNYCCWNYQLYIGEK